MVVSVLDFASLEADVNLGGPFRRHLGEGDVLNDVGEQPLAFAVRRMPMVLSIGVPAID
ncbi:hypothetical protein Q2941_50085 [Bradyrhizobium sp. UFLA05-153]